MFKLVVLSAVLAVACAKPSLHSLGYAPVHSAYVAAPAVYAAPSAVSHQSRVDVHSSPVVASYVAAPAVSVHASPVHVAYSAPVVSAYTPALAHGTPAVVQGLDGRPLDTVEVVNARAAHYTAKALESHGHHGIHALFKRSIHAPVAYSVVAAPAAVSHQSRVDVHSSPVVVSHAAHSIVAAPAYSTYSAHPVASYVAAPAVSVHSSPAHVAYSAPVVSAYTPALAHGTPAIVQGLDGRPLDTVEVVNARAAHYTAKALESHGHHGIHALYKRSIHAPLAYSVVAAPAAVSHQSRVDVHHSTPVVHSVPVVSAYSHYANPLVSAYSTPVLSHYSHAHPAYVHHY